MESTAHVAGAARASNRVGQVEVPIKINDTVIDLVIPTWQARRLIRQLERADVSAREIRRLRSRKRKH